MTGVQTCALPIWVGVVDVVYHKTGNTIEITTGEVADSVRKLSRRRGFGTMTCMGGKVGFMAAFLVLGWLCGKLFGLILGQLLLCSVGGIV